MSLRMFALLLTAAGGAPMAADTRFDEPGLEPPPRRRGPWRAPPTPEQIAEEARRTAERHARRREEKRARRQASKAKSAEKKRQASARKAKRGHR